MLKKTNLGVKPFSTRVDLPCHPIDLEVLWGSLNGATRQLKDMKHWKQHTQREKLKLVIKDISRLINNSTL